MWTLKALQFATVFRREAQRSRAAMTGQLGQLDQVVSLEQAAAADMRGYEDWATAAVQRYCERHGWPSWATLAGFANALCRSPMGEVAWVERALGDGAEPDLDGYDALARRFKFVRAFPRRAGILHLDSAAWARQVARRARVQSALGLLLADEPWLIPVDVADDPAYRGAPLPAADLRGREVRWDADGLRQRVEHEMGVLEDVAGRELAELAEPTRVAE